MNHPEFCNKDYGIGDQAMAFLVKKGKIKFTKQQLADEVNNMVEKICSLSLNGKVSSTY